VIWRVAFIALYLLGIRTTLFITRHGTAPWRLRMASVLWPLFYAFMAFLVVVESFGSWDDSIIDGCDEEDDDPCPHCGKVP
jgi:hypothetical protein